MRGRLITISGPDGVGKSTQARLLVERLLREGRPARAFWFRPGYSHELDAARAFVRRFSRRALPTADQGEARARAFRKPGVSGAWLTMALADTALQLGVKLRSWMARGEAVVCDRYLLDASLDLELRFPAHRERLRTAWRTLDTLCPRPDGAYVLQASPAEVEERLTSKHEPFPDDADTRVARREAYDAMVRAGQATPIDAAGPASQVHERLWLSVRELFV